MAFSMSQSLKNGVYYLTTPEELYILSHKPRENQKSKVTYPLTVRLIQFKNSCTAAAPGRQVPGLDEHERRPHDGQHVHQPAGQALPGPDTIHHQATTMQRARTK